MAIPGIYASHNAALNDNKLSMASRVIQLEDVAESPLLGLSAGMPHFKPSSMYHMWFENEIPVQKANVVNNAGVGASLIFDDSSLLLRSSLCFVPSTGEYFYIDEINQATKTATVLRGVGKTTITALDGTGTPVEIYRISNASEESSDRPDSISTVPTPRYQNLQTFRNGYGVSKIHKFLAMNTTSDKIASSRAECQYNHRVDIESNFIFGVRDTLNRNGNTLLMADGLKNQITTNQYVENVNTSWDDFGQLTQDIFAFNIKGKPNERIGMGGYGLLNWLNSIADLKSEKMLSVGQERYGWKVSIFITKEGNELKYLTHPLFTRAPAFQNDAVIFHPGATSIMKARDAEHEGPESIGTAGKDDHSGILSSDCSIILEAEKCSAWLSGIRNATL